MLFDLSSAFDTVNHGSLLSKLEVYGFDEKALGWVKSYLQDRIQCVSVSGELSEKRTINTGTPQGSRLSPLLFSVLMSDLNLHVNNGLLTNYADDTQLTTIEETEEPIGKKQKLDIEKSSKKKPGRVNPERKK